MYNSSNRKNVSNEKHVARESKLDIYYVSRNEIKVIIHDEQVRISKDEGIFYFNVGVLYRQ
jgi:hypothetical protein